MPARPIRGTTLLRAYPKPARKGDKEALGPLVHRKVHPPRMMATDIVSSKLARLAPSASSETAFVPSSHSRRSEYCNA